MSGPSAPPFLDLQSYLRFLESAGRLRRVQAPVDKDGEIACIARWALESTPDEQSYAILFEQVKDYAVPVAVNLYASHALYASALGVSPQAVLQRWATALTAPQQTVPVESAPAQEVVETTAASLLSIPAPVWTPGRDAGPYLSAGNVITKDPETGVQNLGNYRLQIHDPKRAGLFFGSRMQHGAIHCAKHQELGKPMPVAIVVGAPPAVNFAAAAKTEYGVDELTIAGGLIGAGIAVVPGKTIDLWVPAHAECVIEGWVSPGALRLEGPFGEALGYMDSAAPAAVVEITAITHRRAPVHHGYVQQLPPSDGHLVMELGILGPLWYYLTCKLGLRGLRDLAILRGSAGVSALVAQVEKSAAIHATEIGRVLAKIGFGQKFIYLVDEDLDIRDLETLNWGLSTRVDPERDITIVPHAQTFQVDPAVLARAAGEGEQVGGPPYRSSLAIINATVKCPVPEVSLPGRLLMEKVLTKWSEFGLPPIVPRERLVHLLATHSEAG
jgi:2,5-furandicarboxylate decarboxylase 1